MEFGKRAHHGQPDAEAALAAIDRTIRLREEIEHARQLAAGNALSRVPHAHAYVLADALGLHVDAPPGRREADGVGQEVAHHLIEAHRVGHHHERCLRQFASQRQPLLARGGRGRFACLVHDVADVHRPELQRHHAARQA